MVVVAAVAAGVELNLRVAKIIGHMLMVAEVQVEKDT